MLSIFGGDPDLSFKPAIFNQSKEDSSSDHDMFKVSMGDSDPMIDPLASGLGIASYLPSSRMFVSFFNAINHQTYFVVRY